MIQRRICKSNRILLSYTFPLFFYYDETFVIVETFICPLQISHKKHFVDFNDFKSMIP